jgi:hypothetical protein
MADVNPDTPDVPQVIDPNPINGQIATALRDVGIVVGFLTAIIGFLGKHDLAGLIAYIRSSDALPALGVLMTAAIFVYRQWLSRRETKVKVLAATSEPNTAVVVKGSENA